MKSTIRLLTVTLAAALALCFMTAVSFADTEIPEGTPFMSITSDVEGADIKVADTGKTVESANYAGVTAPLYRITLPWDVNTVQITTSREGIYFNPTYGNNLSGCTNKGNGMTSFNNAEYTDDTITFPVTPANFSTDDDYWAAVYKVNEWNGPGGPKFAFTFERVCDHQGEGVEITHLDGEEATCTEEGNHEVWYCSKCDKFFTDEAMTEKIAREDVIIPPLGHNFGEDSLCTRCGIRGDATVEFSGAKVDEITDESADRTKENAGLDFTFKVDNAFVAYNPLATLTVIFTRSEHVVVYAGDVTIKGVTVPNYKVYGVTTNVRLRGYTDDFTRYIMAYDSDGKSLGWNARYNDITAGEQYFAGTSSGNGGSYVIGETAEPYFGFIPCTGEPEIKYDELTPDEDGVYTIPAEKLKVGSTVRVLVDKTAVGKVEDKIDAIGDVTTENAAEKQEAITAAREAYEALPDEDKAKVDPAKLSALAMDEQIAALAGTITDQTTDEEKALIEAQVAAMKQTQEAIEALSEEVKALKESAEADAEKIADLEAQIADLQTQVQELGEAAATKAELEEQVAALNDKIAKLENDLADVKNTADSAASGDEFNGVVDELKKTIADLEEKLKNAEKKMSSIESNVTNITNKINEGGSSGSGSGAESKDEISVETAKKLKVKGLKAKAKSKKFKISWKKNAKASGYQIQYKLKSAKEWTTLKESTTKTKVSSKKLKKGKKYTFRVRPYQKKNGKIVYGKWAKKTAKCK